MEYPLQLGGMQNGSQVKEQLQQLLIQHGVAPARLATCADELLVALGPASVGSILKSPKPWTDLKARANYHQSVSYCQQSLKK